MTNKPNKTFKKSLLTNTSSTFSQPDSDSDHHNSHVTKSTTRNSKTQSNLPSPRMTKASLAYQCLRHIAAMLEYLEQVSDSNDPTFAALVSEVSDTAFPLDFKFQQLLFQKTFSQERALKNHADSDDEEQEEEGDEDNKFGTVLKRLQEVSLDHAFDSKHGKKDKKSGNRTDTKIEPTTSASSGSSSSSSSSSSKSDKIVTKKEKKKRQQRQQTLGNDDKNTKIETPHENQQTATLKKKNQRKKPQLKKGKAVSAFIQQPKEQHESETGIIVSTSSSSSPILDFPPIGYQKLVEANSNTQKQQAQAQAPQMLSLFSPPTGSIKQKQPNRFIFSSDESACVCGNCVSSESLGYQPGNETSNSLGVPVSTCTTNNNDNILNDEEEEESTVFSNSATLYHPTSSNLPSAEQHQHQQQQQNQRKSSSSQIQSSPRLFATFWEKNKNLLKQSLSQSENPIKPFLFSSSSPLSRHNESNNETSSDSSFISQKCKGNSDFVFSFYNNNKKEEEEEKQNNDNEDDEKEKEGKVVDHLLSDSNVTVRTKRERKGKEKKRIALLDQDGTKQKKEHLNVSKNDWDSEYQLSSFPKQPQLRIKPTSSASYNNKTLKLSASIQKPNRQHYAQPMSRTSVSLQNASSSTTNSSFINSSSTSSFCNISKNEASNSKNTSNININNKNNNNNNNNTSTLHKLSFSSSTEKDYWNSFAISQAPVPTLPPFPAFDRSGVSKTKNNNCHCRQETENHNISSSSTSSSSSAAANRFDSFSNHLPLNDDNNNNNNTRSKSEDSNLYNYEAIYRSKSSPVSRSSSIAVQTSGSFKSSSPWFLKPDSENSDPAAAIASMEDAVFWQPTAEPEDDLATATCATSTTSVVDNVSQPGPSNYNADNNKRVSGRHTTDKSLRISHRGTIHEPVYGTITTSRSSPKWKEEEGDGEEENNEECVNKNSSLSATTTFNNNNKNDNNTNSYKYNNNDNNNNKKQKIVKEKGKSTTVSSSFHRQTPSRIHLDLEKGVQENKKQNKKHSEINNSSNNNNQTLISDPSSSTLHVSSPSVPPSQSFSKPQQQHHHHHYHHHQPKIASSSNTCYKNLNPDNNRQKGSTCITSPRPLSQEIFKEQDTKQEDKEDEDEDDDGVPMKHSESLPLVSPTQDHDNFFEEQHEKSTSSQD